MYVHNGIYKYEWLTYRMLHNLRYQTHPMMLPVLEVAEDCPVYLSHVWEVKAIHMVTRMCEPCLFHASWICNPHTHTPGHHTYNVWITISLYWIL